MEMEMEMELKLKMGQRNLFALVLEAITELVEGAVFMFDKSGFYLEAKDQQNKALALVQLSPQAFAYYRCTDDVSFGLNVDTMSKVFKCLDSDALITLTFDIGFFLVNFLSPDLGWESGFRLEVINPDILRYKIPKDEFDAKVTMPSLEFARICKFLDNIGGSDRVMISVTSEQVEFSTTVVSRAVSVQCSKNNANKPEDATLIEMNKLVRISLELSYLCSFTKATPVSNTVSLTLRTGAALKVEYKIEEMGSISFFVNN